MPDISTAPVQPIDPGLAQQSLPVANDAGTQSLPPLITLNDAQQVHAVTEQSLQPMQPGGQFMQSITASVGEFQQWPDVNNIANKLTNYWQQGPAGMESFQNSSGYQGGGSQPQWVIDGVKLSPPSQQVPNIESVTNDQRKALPWIIGMGNLIQEIALKGADMSLWTARFSLLSSIVGNMLKGISTLFKNGGS